MQKILLSLIEGWVADGAPDPGTYGSKIDGAFQESGKDLKARQAIVDLATELKKVQARLAVLEQHAQAVSVDQPNFDAFYDALREAAAPVPMTQNQVV